MTLAQRLVFLRQMAVNPEVIEEIVGGVKAGELPDGDVFIRTLEGIADANHAIGVKTRDEIKMRLGVERNE